MQHVYTLPYPNRDGSYGSNRGSTIADVQLEVQATHRQYGSAGGTPAKDSRRTRFVRRPPATSQRGAPKDGHTHRGFG
jgi:hypothetical protein